jgi:hypothetical protein
VARSRRGQPAFAARGRLRSRPARGGRCQRRPPPQRCRRATEGGRAADRRSWRGSPPTPAPPHRPAADRRRVRVSACREHRYELGHDRALLRPGEAGEHGQGASAGVTDRALKVKCQRPPLRDGDSRSLPTGEQIHPFNDRFCARLEESVVVVLERRLESCIRYKVLLQGSL